jgi:serine/threonine protein kinase
MTHSATEGDTLTGAVLAGRYRIDALIGRGGMARVYRAHDEVLGRDVALKLFTDATEDSEHATRAQSEVRILASLNHPSLVTLYDARVDPRHDAFLVMELVDGPTLRDRIAAGPLDADDIATMATDLAEALHAVHAAGMVHRDIKPSNVLLAPSISPHREFRAKLADFGIAHLIDSARLTTPGTIMGTAAYLSPEQTRGVAPVPAGDVYSLGLVLLECFTRERAFPGGMTESLVARVQRDPEIPGTIGYGWKSLLTAMTSRAPENRPTALEAAEAARSLLSSTGPSAPHIATSTATLAAQTPNGTDAHPEVRSPAPTVRAAAVAAPAATIALPLAASDPMESTATERLSVPLGRRARRSTNPATRGARRTRTWGLAAATVVVAAIVGTGVTGWLTIGQPAESASGGSTIRPIERLLETVTTVDSEVVLLVDAARAAAAEATVEPTVDETTVTDAGVGTDVPAPATGSDPVEEEPAPPAETVVPPETGNGNSGSGNAGNGNTGNGQDKDKGKPGKG